MKIRFFAISVRQDQRFRVNWICM